MDEAEEDAADDTDYRQLASPTAPPTPATADETVEGNEVAKAEEGNEGEQVTPATIDQVIEAAGVEDTFDYMEQLGESPQDLADPSDAVFSQLEAVVISTCANRAQELGVSAKDMQGLSDFVRDHSDLKNAINLFGSTRSLVPVASLFQPSKSDEKQLNGGRIRSNLRSGPLANRVLHGDSRRC